MRRAWWVASILAVFGCGARSPLDGDAAASDASTPDVIEEAPAAVSNAWAVFDTARVAPTVGPFAGTTFDGRYVYFAPAATYDGANDGSTVVRLDTEGDFTDPSAWSTFDIIALDLRARGFAGAVFDGRYVYLVPDLAGSGDGIGAAIGHVVARYDTHASFASQDAWSVFDTMKVGASGFCGATYDGHYVYFVPFGGYDPLISTTAITRLAARLDVTRPFDDPSAWTTFDLDTLPAGAQTRCTAVYDGRYVYMPDAVSAYTGFGGIVTRYDTHTSFSNPQSWSEFNVSSVNPGAKGFAGAAFDGHYVYVVPEWNGIGVGVGGDGIFARYDVSGVFNSAAAWTTPVYTIDPYAFATFDGRYVYFPSSGTDGAVARLDTTTRSWDSIGPPASLGLPTYLSFDGGVVFDGHFVYFIADTRIYRYAPSGVSSLPGLPAFHGSFF